MRLRRKNPNSEPTVTKPDGNQDTESSGKLLRMCLLLILCSVVGIANYAHASYMQESHTMFSHLSNLERELSFRTEMGFYYSFFKQVISAPSVSAAVGLLVRDNVTEYPDTINALQRFNVYPEVAIGLLYRLFSSVGDQLGIVTRTCYMVNRGGDLPTVRSCEGPGEPTIFYVQAVLLLNGLMLAFFCLCGYLVSGGTFTGAVVTSASYFFNHRECTRVQWSPPLRESFAYPFLVMQQLFLVVLLQKRNADQVCVSLCDLAFLIGR